MDRIGQLIEQRGRALQEAKQAEAELSRLGVSVMDGPHGASWAIGVADEPGTGSLGYVKNCFLFGRESDGPLFVKQSGGPLVAHLDGYCIVAIERLADFKGHMSSAVGLGKKGGAS